MYEEKAILNNLSALNAMGVYDYDHHMWGRTWPTTSPPIRLLEDASRSNNDGGYILWPPALTLAKFCEMRTEEMVGKTVVELGAGCGVAAMVCASLGAASVTACEHPCVFPWLAQNLSLNPAHVVNGVSWDWNVDPPKSVPLSPDIIIAADVTYCPKLHAIFLSTVLRLMRGRNNPECVLYLFHDDASIPGNARHRSMFLKVAVEGGLDVSELDLVDLTTRGYAEDTIHGYEMRWKREKK